MSRPLPRPTPADDDWGLVRNPGLPIARPEPRARRVTINGVTYACFEANALLEFIADIEAVRTHSD
jgi:hypothetical protein